MNSNRFHFRNAYGDWSRHVRSDRFHILNFLLHRRNLIGSPLHQRHQSDVNPYRVVIARN